MIISSVHTAHDIVRHWTMSTGVADFNGTVRILHNVATTLDAVIVLGSIPASIVARCCTTSCDTNLHVKVAVRHRTTPCRPVSWSHPMSSDIVRQGIQRCLPMSCAV